MTCVMMCGIHGSMVAFMVGQGPKSGLHLLWALLGAKGRKVCCIYWGHYWGPGAEKWVAFIRASLGARLGQGPKSEVLSWGHYWGPGAERWVHPWGHYWGTGAENLVAFIGVQAALLVAIRVHP